jgi:hypothetical protein
MALTKVLNTVKTYPTLSAKYDELVCTAGFREDGTWIRLYPVPFRKKSYNTSDFRPESFRPNSIDTEIKVIGHIDTANNWEERRKICLGKIYHNLTELIAEAKNKNIGTSLAVFKPTEILDFTAELVDREWDKDKLAKLNQLNLFETNKEGKFEVVQKLPYKFKFHFKDNQGTLSHMMIEDWETGQLYQNCLARHEGDEEKAIVDVRKKYFDDFAKTKDLHFFLGTTAQFHSVAPNPFIIIGTFQPKIELQGSLF